MKLRYMREQRDRARDMLQQKDQEIEERRQKGQDGQISTKTSRKRTKFQLDDSDSGADNNDVFMGFTHKGKRLDVNDHDDFNEDISADSDDDKNDRTKRKGFLNEEMVEKLNFGGGDQDDEGGEKKKTRKEVFEEIIEKSRSYDAARKELKQINLNMQRELDEDYGDLLGRLNYKDKTIQAQDANKALHDKLTNKFKEKKKDKPEEQTYEQIAAALKS